MSVHLAGFPQAINAVFPQTEIQTCIVHQIRNSLKCVASKDQKAFMKDLKPFYQVEMLELAELRLDQLEEKWGKKYEKVLESWLNNWSKLTTYFRYDAVIRKLIYAANMIEGFHRRSEKSLKQRWFYLRYGFVETDLSCL